MITAVDAHAGGEPGRVITGGVTDVPGETMFAKMEHLREHRDALRKLMLREPRELSGTLLQHPAAANASGSRCRVRDHGAGRIPTDVGIEHDLHGDRAAGNRNSANAGAGDGADASKRPRVW